VLEMRVFGAVEAFPSFTRSLQELWGAINWPLVYVQGNDCGGGEVAGIQLHAVTGSNVETIRADGRPIGRVFEDQFARYCVLGDLRSVDPSRSGTQQTQDTIEQMMKGLAGAGMDIHKVARTWFFIDDILGWYQEFNGARSEIYTTEGLFGRYLPASTGIGGQNPYDAAVLASALGINPKKDGVAIQEIPSPLQCPALDYGSSFTRAAELVTPDYRQVLVSGTASIDPDGVTTHLDDLDAQIDYTLEIVGAILESRGMDFSDVIRGNAYFKHSGEAGNLGLIAGRHGLPMSRVVVSQNHVCRGDLLFELEVDAVRPQET
ncbi:MAG: hypothetical protein HKO65_17795, partial [Gemmatimonadetes bacterium]|nr:hypothetical protein [Gemmatimonadota bacterium]